MAGGPAPRRAAARSAPGGSHGAGRGSQPPSPWRRGGGSRPCLPGAGERHAKAGAGLRGQRKEDRTFPSPPCWVQGGGEAKGSWGPRDAAAFGGGRTLAQLQDGEETRTPGRAFPARSSPRDGLFLCREMLWPDLGSTGAIPQPINCRGGCVGFFCNLKLWCSVSL